ncbi:pentapeptide repeat-containing protein [Streptomyces scabiei]|uniref:pentapeptide repeat-containing protein n=1 Tax=Streptomyces scabiei TaxID=1930 RepID=UPI000A982269|nr:pentapeptide repeat-containing protein [Streptomyces scabiei]
MIFSPCFFASASSASSPPWTLIGTALGAAIAALAGILVARYNARQLWKKTERELGHERSRLLNERFATASQLLGSKQPAVRLAGVHAMAGLADDWEEQRQTCVNVLCAYLRMPYEPEPAADAPSEKRLSWQASREVRHTVVAVIREHLLPNAAMSWEGFDFNFTGAVFDGGSFQGAQFTDGHVTFDGARFPRGTVDFAMVHFAGASVSFRGASFTGSVVNFGGSHFSDGVVGFESVQFVDGNVNFSAHFTGGKASFQDATFKGGKVHFVALFQGSTVDFSRAQFAGGEVSYQGAAFERGKVSFWHAHFAGSAVLFRDSRFRGGKVPFVSATFERGMVDFSGARFTGSLVDFGVAEFNGGTVDFRGARFTGKGRVDLAACEVKKAQPIFDHDVWQSPPPGLLLPAPLGSTRRMGWLRRRA